MNSHILPHRSSTIQKVYLLEKQARGKNFLWQVFRHSWEGVEGPWGGVIGLGLGIEEEEGTRLAVRRIGVCPVNWSTWSVFPTARAQDLVEE